MNQSKYAITLFLTILSLMLFRCDDVSFDKQEFVGNWVVSEVIYDGVLQDEWVGTKIYFDQLTKDSGTYSLLTTPYDSIWGSNGMWNGTDQKNIFLRDNNIPVQYWFDNNNFLFLDMYLPWTQQSTCIDSVCLPVVTGQWTFKLNK